VVATDPAPKPSDQLAINAQPARWQISKQFQAAPALA